MSGRERLVAAVTVGAFSKAASDTVTVRWPGLVAMDRVATTYEFKNQDPDVSPTQRHGNVNNWIEPTFRTGAIDAFQRYFDAVPVGQRFPIELPGGGFDTRIVITDVSLEWGGLFDVDSAGPWHNPHKTHRKGTDMDVLSTTMNDVAKQRFVAACLPHRLPALLSRIHRSPTISRTFISTPVDPDK